MTANGHKFDRFEWEESFLHFSRSTVLSVNQDELRVFSNKVKDVILTEINACYEMGYPQQ